MRTCFGIWFDAIKAAWAVKHQSQRGSTFVLRGKRGYNLHFVKDGEIGNPTCCVMIKPDEDVMFLVGTTKISVKGPIHEAGGLLVSVEDSTHVLEYDQEMMFGHCKYTLDHMIGPGFASVLENKKSIYETAQIKMLGWKELERHQNIGCKDINVVARRLCSRPTRRFYSRTYSSAVSIKHSRGLK